MNQYCERCYLRDAKPCMECSTCNPGHRNFRAAPPKNKTTHADRIRSMSNEELAAIIIQSQKQDPALLWCRDDTCYERFEDDNFDCTDELQTRCILRWLLEPAEEE